MSANLPYFSTAVPATSHLNLIGFKLDFNLLPNLALSNIENNKLEFKGHPQRISKPISDQNLLTMFQS